MAPKRKKSDWFGKEWAHLHWHSISQWEFRDLSGQREPEGRTPRLPKQLFEMRNQTNERVPNLYSPRRYQCPPTWVQSPWERNGWRERVRFLQINALKYLKTCHSSLPHSPIIVGSHPTAAYATTLARGFRLLAFTASSPATTRAAAPSEIPLIHHIQNRVNHLSAFVKLHTEALPALTSPSFWKTGFSLARDSTVVVGRGCSSTWMTHHHFNIHNYVEVNSALIPSWYWPRRFPLPFFP